LDAATKEKFHTIIFGFSIVHLFTPLTQGEGKE